MKEPRLVMDGHSLIAAGAVAENLSRGYRPVRDDQLGVATAELLLVLQVAEQRFVAGGEPVQTMRWVVEALHKLRRKTDPAIWQALTPIAQEHPVADYFHQDPFTRWSFEKPRGYSGDAHLLDFIYCHESVAGEVAASSPIGRALYDFSQYYPSCVAVRERRDILARMVDEIAEVRGPETEVLTIAAGHLREAENTAVLANGGLRRWVAADQDPMSIGTIVRDNPGTPIEALDCSVRTLLTETHNLGTFDFVYSAGLYDYLTDAVAIRLTKRCMRMLKPGGTLLFANFSPELTDDGYMETFMNWALLLRSEADMWKIINASVERNSVDASVFFGENRNIVYATVTRRD